MRSLKMFLNHHLPVPLWRFLSLLRMTRHVWYVMIIIVPISSTYFFVRLFGFLGYCLKYLNVGFMCSLNDHKNLDLLANALSQVSWTTFQLFEICHMLNITVILIIYSIAYLRRSWWNWSRTCTSPIQGWKETTPKTSGTNTIATIRLARG